MSFCQAKQTLFNDYFDDAANCQRVGEYLGWEAQKDCLIIAEALAEDLCYDASITWVNCYFGCDDGGDPF